MMTVERLQPAEVFLVLELGRVYPASQQRAAICTPIDKQGSYTSCLQRGGTAFLQTFRLLQSTASGSLGVHSAGDLEEVTLRR